MLYLKSMMLGWIIASMFSVIPSVAAADCRSIIQNSNKKLTWTIFDAGGTKIASGRIIVSKTTNEGYFETRHSGGSNPPMSFYGGFDDNTIMYINPDYQELWIGTCSGDKIVGTVKKSRFEITQ